MLNVSVFCFLASYAVAFLLELTRLLRRSSISRFVMLAFGFAGFVAHTIYLVMRSRAAGAPPLLTSAHDWVLVLAWLAVLFYLFLTAIDRNLAVGVFLLPLVLLLIGAAYFVNAQTNSLVTEAQGWAMLHASLFVFGIADVLVGFVLGMMYMAQHRRLKSKTTQRTGLTLPSLERLARWNWWSVIISVPLLTLGMLTGVRLGFIANTGPNTKPHLVSFQDPLVVGTVLTWLVMVVFFVWLLKTKRPAGKQVAWLTLWAFGFLLVTLIGLQVFSGSSLNSWHT